MYISTHWSWEGRWIDALTERMVVWGSKPWDCYKSPTVCRILSSCLQERSSKNVLRLRGLDRGLHFQDNSQVFHCNLSTDHTMNDLGRGSLEGAQGVGYQEENWGSVDRSLVPSKNCQQSRLSWQGRCDWRPQVAGAGLSHVTDIKKKMTFHRKGKKRYF